MESTVFSQRSKMALPVMLQGLLLQQKNPFSANNNPDGLINGGVAENTLALKWLVPQFTSITMEEDDFKYGELQGSSKLRLLIAQLFNRHLLTTLNKNNLSLHNGAGSTIENLVFNICDLNDEVLIPRPYYGGFEMDIQYRMGVKVCGVETLNYRITMPLLEAAIKKCKAPKALVFCNPDNPTGLCRTPEEILVAIEFCKKYDIHLISDEIYALTAYNSFKSIFHPDLLPLIDKQKTHVVWSFSKDFCMNGVRVGVFCSLNRELVNQMHNSCYFSAISRFADIHLTQFLTNEPKVDEFLRNNKNACLEALRNVVSFFESHGIPFITPNGGFYLYFNFGKYLKTTEEALFLDLIDAGVYMPRGEAFFDSNKGWFRITYALKENELNLLLQRLNKIVQQ